MRQADNLVIDSVAKLQLNATAWPVFDVAASAIFYPFRYPDRPGALTIQQYPDPVGRLRGWARAFVGGNPTDTLALLKDLSAGVSGWIRYQSRKDEGTQSPTLTLDRGWGSCRDFAVLFVEAARCLGFLEGAAPAGPARIPANPEPYMFWRLAIVDFIVAHSDVFAGSRAYR